MATLRLITLAPADELGPLPPHADPPRTRRGLRILERLLIIIGIVCLGYFVYVTAETALYQAYETRELDAILASAPEPRPVATTSVDVPLAPLPPRAEPRSGSLLGRLEIPRLHVSAIVRAGSDARTLRLAIGHIGGTALPGERGNVGLAAHRDTFFRRLGEIRVDDQVRLVTRDGTFTYRVEGTRVVEPQDVWVLDQTTDPALTLITCYPFRYIGSAPQRFIVRAQLIGG
jgi:sortase A